MNWYDHFNVEIGTPDAAFSTLVSCLELKTLNESMYAQWAGKNFKLPVLKDNYFTHKPPQAELLKKFKGPWNSVCYPIAVIKGKVFIACLEPSEIQLTAPVQFVIATYSCLVSNYPNEALITPEVQLEEKIESSHPIAIEPKVQTPNPLATDTPPPESQPNKLEEVPSKAPTAQTEDSGLPDILAGLSFGEKPNETVSASSNTNEHKSLSHEESSQKTTAPESSLPEEDSGAVLSGLDFGAALATKPEPEAEPKKQHQEEVPPTVPETAPNFTLESPKKPKIEVTAAPKGAEPVKEQKINMSPKVESFREVTQAASRKRQSHAKKISEKTIVPFPDKTQDFTFVRTVFSDQIINDAPSELLESKDPHEALMSAFKKLSSYYHKLMWSVKDSTGHVYPIISDHRWDFTDQAWDKPLDFQSAGPFRLSKFTKQPFHGAVPKVFQENNFFKEWCQGEVPNYITVVPVKIYGHVFGYFIGCGKGEHFHSQYALDTMENVSLELVDCFIQLYDKLSPQAS